MAESKTTVSLVPLNGSNYPTWKVQCRMALVRDGLWGIVEGTETAPPAEGTADRRSKFIARRDRALATIVLAVEPSLLYLIGDPEDPVVVWQKLQDQFPGSVSAENVGEQISPSTATTLAEIEGRRVSSRAYQDHDRVVQ